MEAKSVACVKTELHWRVLYFGIREFELNKSNGGYGNTRALVKATSGTVSGSGTVGPVGRDLARYFKTCLNFVTVTVKTSNSGPKLQHLLKEPIKFI
ncbi:MAG: hypothetical protein IPN13_14800 [Bacteroidetes bacterium]|nr:hypothetical protein [Bacteroidota bacterium]